MDDPYPVYIVEDDELASEALRLQLEATGRSCRAFATSTAFLEAMHSLEPGVILLDLRLPGVHGLDLLDAIDEDIGPFAVVIVSASRQVNDAIGAFRRGVVDYLRKPWTPSELADVLLEADEEVGKQLKARQRREQAEDIHLTDRELEVLRAMAEGRQSKIIAYELGLSIRTVDMHRSNIMAKLNARGASHALAIAKELGLI